VLGDLEFRSDVHVADWLVQRLHGFAVNVGSIIPDGIAAYARIFHPAEAVAVRAADGGFEPSEEVRWAQIAAWSGRTVHPEMQFEAISVPTPGRDPGPAPWDGDEPECGMLPYEKTKALADVLARHTRRPDRCWFAVWKGWAEVAGTVMWLTAEGSGEPLPPVLPPEAHEAPKLRIPGRDMLLFHGPVAAVGNFVFGSDPEVDFRSPNLWWPDDRAWCVASEIDFSWTYVGGSTALIDELLGDDRFEALPARITDGISVDSDRLNR
jgi:hypothetical protein